MCLFNIRDILLPKGSLHFVLHRHIIIIMENHFSYFWFRLVLRIQFCMDLYNFVKLDPYPHQRQKLDPDPNLDQHCDTGSPRNFGGSQWSHGG
jgi:hypothetical protein